MRAPFHAWLSIAALVARHAVTVAARHTGVPSVLVAAFGLVFAYRVARRSVHLVLEVALAVALVMAATRAGWIRF